MADNTVIETDEVQEVNQNEETQPQEEENYPLYPDYNTEQSEAYDNR